MVSVIIPARNEGPLLRATLGSVARACHAVPYEVVVVDEGGNDLGPADLRPGSRSVRTAGEGAAAARNRGLEASRGDPVVFCDAHVDVPDGWLDRLVAGLEETGADAVAPGIRPSADPPPPARAAAGFGFTWGRRGETLWLPRPPAPAAVPFLPGACLCARRAALARVGGWFAGLVPWGYEDAELSLALWLCGLQEGCFVLPDLTVGHHFRGRHPYPVLQAAVDDNLRRVAAVHFGSRLGVTPLEDEAAAQRRAWLDPLRRRSVDWFWERFGLPSPGG